MLGKLQYNANLSSMTLMHALFSLHIRVRGTLTDSAEQADTIFATDQGITPFDVDRIRAEFL